MISPIQETLALDKMIDWLVQLELLIKQKQPTNDSLIEKIFFEGNDLCQIVSTTYSSDQLVELFKKYHKDDLEKYRTIYQSAENIVETITAKKILDGKLSINDYLSVRYNLIAQKQILDFQTYSHSLKSLLFIGSGPIPISAIIFSQLLPNTSVTLLDIDPESLELSSRLLSSMHLHNKIKILPPRDGSYFENYSQYDILCFAAVVGLTSKQKNDFYSNIAPYIEAGKHIFTRAVPETRAETFLYAPFPAESLNQYYIVKKYEKVDPSVKVHNLVLERN